MQTNRNGIALITVMCFMMVLAILGTAFSMAVSSHVRRTSHEMHLESALWIAEAGAERGAAYVAAGGAIPHTFSGTLGDGTFLVTISALDNVADEDEDEGFLVTGSININPNNRNDYLFELKLPNGSVIDRNNLHQGYGGYTGAANSVRVQPKGAGNQNSLTVDGEPYPLSNGTTNLIESGDMTVNLFNDKIKNGKAMGKWYISITASGATITKP